MKDETYPSSFIIGGKSMWKKFLAFATMLVLSLLSACAQPTCVPTTVPATQTPHIITVVVTVTPEPSVTPMVKPTVLSLDGSVVHGNRL